MNETIASLEAKITTLTAKIPWVKDAKDKIAVLEKERDFHRLAVEAVKTASTYVTAITGRRNTISLSANNFSIYLSEIVGTIKEACAEGEREHRMATDTINNESVLNQQIVDVEKAIQRRREQEKRLQPLLPFNAPFGQKQIQFTEFHDFIINQCGVDKLRPMAMEQHRQHVNGVWEQCQIDVEKWIRENEVSEYGARTLRFSGDAGLGHTWGSVLYRSINDHGFGSYYHRIDPVARMLFVPFSDHEIQAQMIKKMAKNVGMPLNEIPFLVSDGAIKQYHSYKAEENFQ